MPKTIIKVAGMILFALFTAITSWPDVNLGIPIDPRWISFGSFIIFCCFIGWYMVGQNQRLQKLEGTKPMIDVTPQKIYGEIYLDVVNEGEKAIFEANITICYSSTGNTTHDILAMNMGYKALWNSSGTNKAEIMKGHSDAIKIATIKSIAVYAEKIILHAYNVADNSPYTMESSAWMSTEDNRIIKPEFVLQVNISSDPSLKPSPNLINGSFVRNYVVNLNEIREYYTQSQKGFKTKLIEADITYVDKSEKSNLNE